MEKKRASHPHITKLLNDNPAFKKYPIIPDLEPFREQLPVLADGTTKSKIWAFLSKAVGKDLTKITMPVIFNEPLTMLQKCAENLEYHDLLRTANNCDNRSLRIGYVIASSYMLCSNVVNRIHKIFNPIIGETYEYFEKDLRIIVEQVSHHPPISAIYAESNDFIFEGEFIRRDVSKDEIKSDKF